MASILKVDKLDPQSGTDLEIGSSGDTITIPSGATFTQSGTMNASAITAGTIATARLGTGTASSSTVLYGDNTWGVGGTTWESKSADFTAAASKAYFCDTTSNNIDVTLPSGVIGDEIHFLDVSGTFDTNDLTILYGSSKIQGASSNLDVATERAGFTLIYYNATQGWLLKDK